jgi:hypothetical protein
VSVHHSLHCSYCSCNCCWDQLFLTILASEHWTSSREGPQHKLYCCGWARWSVRYPAISASWTVGSVRHGVCVVLVKQVYTSESAVHSTTMAHSYSSAVLRCCRLHTGKRDLRSAADVLFSEESCCAVAGNHRARFSSTADCVVCNIRWRGLEFIQSHIGPTNNRFELYGFGKCLLDNISTELHCFQSIHRLVILDWRCWCILVHHIWSLLSHNLLWHCTHLLPML